MTPIQLCDKARLLYEQENLSCAEIGRRLGVTRQRIHQLVLKFEFKHPSRASRDDLHRLVADHMGQGLTNGEISEQLGMSLGSLQALLITHPNYEQLKRLRKQAKRAALIA